MVDQSFHCDVGLGLCRVRVQKKAEGSKKSDKPRYRRIPDLASACLDMALRASSFNDLNAVALSLS